MKTIGTTTDGGLLVMMAAGEIEAIEKAIFALRSILPGTAIPQPAAAIPRTIVLPEAPKPAAERKPGRPPKRVEPVSQVETKTCKTCGESKVRDLFPKAGRLCKACVSELAKAKYEAKKKAAGKAPQTPAAPAPVMAAPTRPVLSKEQRRIEIRKAHQRLREREELDIPREGGRALPVGQQD